MEVALGLEVAHARGDVQRGVRQQVRVEEHKKPSWCPHRVSRTRALWTNQTQEAQVYSHNEPIGASPMNEAYAPLRP
eukprot:3788822-Pyramimonas_sp.AAC.1